MSEMKVKYIGADDAQAKFGGSNDPRNILRIGDTYNVVEQELHKWHTLYILKGYPGYKFNSVCFEEKSK